MDILARIEEVIKQRGTNKAEVSERMGKAKQNFKSLLTNPKWDSLELVCKAIGIEPWQLFEQEIEAAGYRRTAEPAPQTEAAAEPSAPAAPQTEGELPTNPAIFRCPHCGAGVVMEVLVVQPPIYKPEDVQEQESESSEQSSDEH